MRLRNAQFRHIVLGVEGGYLAGFGEASLGATPSPSQVCEPSAAL
jgi:hypothetical protein